MASVETRWFTKGGKNLVEAEIGWVTGPINVMLMAAGYVFDQDGPEVYADVSPSEAVGAGYVVGGKLLANRSVVIDAPSNETHLLADDIEWAGSTITARGAVIYVNGGAKPVLGYTDFETDRLTNLGRFLIEWPDTGALRMAAVI